MAIPSDSPRVALLKKDFEEVFGRPIRTPRDFLEAVTVICNKTGAIISETTVRRLYKENDKYAHVSDDILNILSKAAGYKHFQDYCDYLSNAGIKDSEFSTGTNSIKSSELTAGDRLYIAWLPDRECSLRYLGENRFLVEESVNATIKAGDTFSCLSFAQGRCLYVDDLINEGIAYDSFAMGRANGLTCVKKI